MANLKADSPLCRRIVLSFLDFLNSVEPTSASDAESLEVAKDCLSEAFKIDSSSSTVAQSESLVQMFNSRTGQNDIKPDQIHEEYRSNTSRTSFTNNAVDTKASGASQHLGDINKQDTRTIGVPEDELFGQFFGALEKVHYFATTVNGDDEQALDRATQLFHSALTEMKKSGCEEYDVKNLADAFKLQGNKAMQSKVYTEAVELYSVAIALRNDNAVYYCNRAAAYTQIKKYAEAIRDCQQAIAIDPNYSKAYSRLGFTYYTLGKYRDAIKAFKKALQLDPNNESVRGNIQAAGQKLREHQQRAERNQHRSSSSASHSNGDHSGGGSRSHGHGLAPPFTSIPFNLNGLPFDVTDIPGILRNMDQQTPVGSDVTDDPGIRVGVNVGDQMPEELYGTIRSVMEMFTDGTSHVNSENNSDGN